MKKRQGKRIRARDSRGRVIKGLYTRDGRWIAGFQSGGRWRMVTLEAQTLTEARRERDSLRAGLDEGRVAQPDGSTVLDLFEEWQDARTLAPRTRTHERQLLDSHLGQLKNRRVQSIGPRDIAKLLRSMREPSQPGAQAYSPWTCTAVYRLLVGIFALAVRRGVITRSPVDGLAPSERPKQKNAKRIAVIDGTSMEALVAGASTERWRAAIALAGFAGLRLGELRGLRWGDLDFEQNTLTISRSLQRDGQVKGTKTEAGMRTVPLLPALRRVLVAWRLKSPHTDREDYVICTHDGTAVMERNLRRTLERAKSTAGLDGTDERLSWHSLRHSFASMLATDLELPATTLARLTGHADAGFTLKVYAKDRRDEAAVVADLLERAHAAGVGG